ncbi:hypothetical protein HYX18_00090 [Candidatus Woesearchaeota archaeon]|nr:hypothetical protein [Candidatus Woesearchaeota archaeon]
MPKQRMDEKKESIERLVQHFNRLVSSRDYRAARDFYRAQSKPVQREIISDPAQWYKSLNCSSL